MTIEFLNSANTPLANSRDGARRCGVTLLPLPACGRGVGPH